MRSRHLFALLAAAACACGGGSSEGTRKVKGPKVVETPKLPPAKPQGQMRARLPEIRRDQAVDTTVLRLHVPDARHDER